MRAELKVDAKTAKRLGSGRTVATYRKTLKAGTTSFTVNLSSKVKRALLRKVKSFKATLTVSVRLGRRRPRRSRSSVETGAGPACASRFRRVRRQRSHRRSCSGSTGR